MLTKIIVSYYSFNALSGKLFKLFDTKIIWLYLVKLIKKAHPQRTGLNELQLIYEMEI